MSIYNNYFITFAFKILPLLFFINLAMAKDYKDLVKMKIQSYQDQNNKQYLALIFKNKKDWHTYWKNPGDAGTPLQHKFWIDEQPIELEEMEWPAPKKYIEGGNLEAFGYENLYAHFFKIPDSFYKQNINKKFKVQSNWLVCKDICIPGKKELTGTILFLDWNTPSNDDFSTDKNLLTELFKKIPKSIPWPEGLKANLYKTESENQLLLTYELEGSQNQLIKKSNLFFPFPNKFFTFQHEQLYKKGSNIVGIIPIEWDGIYFDNPIELPKDGNFNTPINFKFLFANPVTQSYQVINLNFSGFQNDLYKEKNKLLPISAPDLTGPTSPSHQFGDKIPLSLPFILIMAFLGGLILNIMPCVLPVISIKLFGLMKQREKGHSSIMVHNISYSLGILFSFLVLSSFVVAFKSSGEQIGWGFHLQSPSFVFAMIVIIFILALNLFGLFEFKTPGGNILGGLNISTNAQGAFLSGILATILSTPCSAPFLGTALGFAFTTNHLNTFLIFSFVGIGLSFPFLLTAFFPQLIRLLPRPGLWMEQFKKFLGLTLLLTTLWLIDVLNRLSNPQMLIYVLLLLTFVFFAFYFQKNISKKLRYRTLYFVIPILFFISIQNDLSSFSIHSEGGSSPEHSSKHLQWSPWAPERLEMLKTSGEIAFINFTAKWCFTCKINEKLVFDSTEFNNLVKDNNIKLLIGDWTHRDPIIGRWLENYNIFGVPAYFVLDKKGKLHSLGETISISKIKKFL